MWGSNSVYNVTKFRSSALQHVTTADGDTPPPPPLGTEGSGNSAFAVVVNGVKVFARGGNLVPFELLEATVKPEYIKRTVQSVVSFSSSHGIVFASKSVALLATV
jgi:hypothetical protein